jgi:hypothetical protein
MRRSRERGKLASWLPARNLIFNIWAPSQRSAINFLLGRAALLEYEINYTHRRDATGQY